MMDRHAFQVKAPPADVVGLHTSATSLKAIAPSLIAMELHDAPGRMGHGDEMDFTLWLEPLPVRWQVRVEDVSPSGSVDRPVRGPFESWVHRHTLVQLAEGGTALLDDVKARLKTHALWGCVGSAIWLGLPLLMAYRGWQTRRLLEGAAA